MINILKYINGDKTVAISPKAKYFAKTIALYVLIALLIILMTIIVSRVAYHKAEILFEARLQEYIELAAEENFARIRAVEDAEVRDPEAEAVARVLYGLREYGLSNDAKTAIVEVILNRVADSACEFRTYNTILDVCNQSGQWQGYDADGCYLLEDYKLAAERISDTTAARVIPEGCFFFSVTKGEVRARTLWTGGNEWSVK